MGSPLFNQSFAIDTAQKNWIINGNLDFAQRGATFAAALSGDAVQDRLRYYKSGASVHTVSQSTDVPTLVQSGFQSTNSILIDCTTANASPGATDFNRIAYNMEGYEWAQLINQVVTLSFWVKATKVGTYCVAFLNNGNNRSYVAEYVVNTTATWERKTITLSLNPSGGTNDFTTGRGLQISFALMAGSSNQTTANSWTSTGAYATANQVNACDSTANDFRLSQIMLNTGTANTQFRRAGGNIAEELALCQRYYEKSYDLTTVPGTSTQVGSMTVRGSISSTQSWPIQFKVTKCPGNSPVLIPYSILGTANRITDLSTGGFPDVTATIPNGGQSGAFVQATVVDSNGYGWQWICNAELS